MPYYITLYHTIPYYVMPCFGPLKRRPSQRRLLTSWQPLAELGAAREPWLWDDFLCLPGFPLQGAFKGDIDVDMDVNLDMAVSMNWGVLQKGVVGSFEGSCQGDIGPQKGYYLGLCFEYSGL